MDGILLYNHQLEALDASSPLSYVEVKYIQIKDQHAYDELVDTLEETFNDQFTEYSDFGKFREFLPEGPGIWYWNDVYDHNRKIGTWIKMNFSDLEEFIFDLRDHLKECRSRWNAFSIPDEMLDYDEEEEEDDGKEV